MDITLNDILKESLEDAWDYSDDELASIYGGDTGYSDYEEEYEPEEEYCYEGTELQTEASKATDYTAQYKEMTVKDALCLPSKKAANQLDAALRDGGLTYAVDFICPSSQEQVIIKLTDKAPQSVVAESSTDLGSIATFMDKVESEIKTAIRKFMQKPNIGFDEAEADEYAGVYTDVCDDYFKVSVWAELSYSSLEDLCTALNPIVAKYDEDAYFEPECPGRAVAYLFGLNANDLKKTESIADKSSIDIGNNQSTDESYTYHTFVYNKQKYSFSECSADYKASNCRNKDYLRGIHPYDDADHPWAWTKHGEGIWHIIKSNKPVDTVCSSDLEDVVKRLQEYDASVEPRVVRD